MFSPSEAAAFDRWITSGPDERFPREGCDCEDCGEFIPTEAAWDDHVCPDEDEEEADADE